jgi:hypothetical protein
MVIFWSYQRGFGNGSTLIIHRETERFVPIAQIHREVKVAQQWIVMKP